MRSSEALEAWRANVGKELFVSDWLTLDGERVDAFRRSALVGLEDIPVLPENASGEDAIDGTYLLSLVLHFKHNHNPIKSLEHFGLNYGYDKVRFLSQVVPGQRVRLRCTVLDAESRGDGVLVRTANIMELQGSAKPAMHVEALSLYLPQHPGRHP